MEYYVNGRIFENIDDAKAYEADCKKIDTERKQKEAERERRAKGVSDAYANYKKLALAFDNDYNAIESANDGGVLDELIRLFGLER